MERKVGTDAGLTEVGPARVEPEKTPGGIIPTLPPKVGDQATKEGYVWWYRVQERSFYPPDLTGNFADMHLEMNTYFVVNISDRSDRESNAQQFRILYEESTGEKLAVFMAAIATLKDAFFRGSKVKVYGKVAEHEVSLMGPTITSAPYNTLRAVEVVHQ